MSKEQIEEMANELATLMLRDRNLMSVCEKFYNAGYRKQSADMVSIETIKKWLYEMAINNVGCVLEGDFSNACEEIISRLDGLKRFAEELKGGVEE